MKIFQTDKAETKMIRVRRCLAAVAVLSVRHRMRVAKTKETDYEKSARGKGF